MLVSLALQNNRQFLCLYALKFAWKSNDILRKGEAYDKKKKKKQLWALSMSNYEIVIAITKLGRQTQNLQGLSH